MTPPQKPEWIEISDKDNSVFPRKVSKGLPVAAFVVTASILGIGSIFAQSAQESPSSVVEMSAPVVQNSQSIEPSPTTGVTQSVATQTSYTPKTTATSKISYTQQSSSAVSPSAPTMINPSIGTLPTGGGDDDEEDDEDVEGSEHESDEDEGDDD